MSAIAAMGCDGVLSVDFLRGSVDGDKFVYFVRGIAWFQVCKSVIVRPASLL